MLVVVAVTFIVAAGGFLGRKHKTGLWCGVVPDAGLWLVRLLLRPVKGHLNIEMMN